MPYSFNPSQFQDIFSEAQEPPLLEEPIVEIDETKREKEVEAIVGSNFFQSIAAKAKTMRQKKQKKVGE